MDGWAAALGACADDREFEHEWDGAAAALRALGRDRRVLALMESAAARPLHARLAPFQRRSLQLSEGAEARRLLAAQPAGGKGVRSLLGTPFGRSTFDRLEESRELLDLGAVDRFVVVGCGPFPAAALFFGERTAATEIVALELDPVAAELARRVLARHGRPGVRVLDGDGADHDYRHSDAVFVANQAAPKHAVLERIASSQPFLEAVLVRDPFGVGRLLADSVDAALPAAWRVARTGALDGTFLSRHLLLSRV